MADAKEAPALGGNEAHPTEEKGLAASTSNPAIKVEESASSFPDPFSLTKELEARIERERNSIGQMDPTQLHSLPVRTYLDQTVVPVIIDGLKALAKERPPNPFEFLALYLLKNGPDVSASKFENSEKVKSNSKPPTEQPTTSTA